MRNYLKTISKPYELWTQIDDTDYWVSSQYRVVSTKRGHNLMIVFFNKKANEHFVILRHNNDKVKCYLDKYALPLIEVSKRLEEKDKKQNKEQAILTYKQKMFEEEVKRYVLSLLGDENHEDFKHYCKVIAESKKACQGKSTCISAYD